MIHAFAALLLYLEFHLTYVFYGATPLYISISL